MENNKNKELPTDKQIGEMQHFFLDTKWLPSKSSLSTNYNQDIVHQLFFSYILRGY